jgi:hypothetical protein
MTITEPEHPAREESVGPASFAAAVILERREVTGNRWINESWEVAGVAVGEQATQGERGPQRVVGQEGDPKQYFRWPGFEVRLYADQAESYWHNLKSEQPLCFVVVRPSEDGSGMPHPFIVTLSYDEAHAYMEAEETVYSVPLPPELYRWTEAFIVKHGIKDTRGKKRKRENWKDKDKEARR